MHGGFADCYPDLIANAVSVSLQTLLHNLATTTTTFAYVRRLALTFSQVGCAACLQLELEILLACLQLELEIDCLPVCNLNLKLLTAPVAWRLC